MCFNLIVNTDYIYYIIVVKIICLFVLPIFYFFSLYTFNVLFFIISFKIYFNHLLVFIEKYNVYDLRVLYSQGCN